MVIRDEFPESSCFRKRSSRDASGNASGDAPREESGKLLVMCLETRLRVASRDASEDSFGEVSRNILWSASDAQLVIPIHSTPHECDKKLHKFAEGLDFLRNLARLRVWKKVRNPKILSTAKAPKARRSVRSCRSAPHFLKQNRRRLRRRP